MNINVLQKRIIIVLDEEVHSYAAKGRIRGALGSMNIGLQSVPNSGWTMEGEIFHFLMEKT